MWQRDYQNFTVKEIYMRLIDATAYAEKIRNIMSCWRLSSCLSSVEANKSIGNLEVALNELSRMPTIERYKVYEIDSKCSYICTSLVAAKTAEEANEYIKSYREVDKDNKGDSWGYSDVSEDDIIENLWSEEPGIIKYDIRYYG